MLFIKKYENFDFNDDDFDFEEENETDFEVGDTVIIDDNISYWRDIKRPNGPRGWVKRSLSNNIRDIKEIIHSSEIGIPDYDGYMVKVTNTMDNIWFKVNDIKLYDTLKENFDFNDDDFDFEEEDESIHPQFQNHQKFYKFLIEHDALDKFITNFKPDHFRGITSIEEYLNSVKNYEIISHSFIWDYTPEGDDYWESLNEKWSETVYRR